MDEMCGPGMSRQEDPVRALGGPAWLRVTEEDADGRGGPCDADQ